MSSPLKDAAGAIIGAVGLGIALLAVLAAIGLARSGRAAPTVSPPPTQPPAVGRVEVPSPTAPAPSDVPSAPFDWNDPCPRDGISSVPDAIDETYGAGERDPVAFVRAEARRLVQVGRRMEPYRRGEAGEPATRGGVDLRGVAEVGCMQRQYQSQALRLQWFVQRARPRNPDAASELFDMIPNLLDVNRCVSGMRGGQALAACTVAERELRL